MNTDHHARTRLRTLVYAVLLLPALALTGCQSGFGNTDQNPPSTHRSDIPPAPAKINHVVFFKLEDPEDAAELIDDCNRRLATIPGVVSYYAGPHYEMDRGNVFSDYDVGFFVGFNSREDYERYVDHPDHVAVVEKWRDRWEWIRVYDVLDPRRAIAETPEP